jgi:dUTP pyrophosphatase
MAKNDEVVKYFKLHEDAIEPKYATTHSACFDLAYCGSGESSVVVYNNMNRKNERQLGPEKLLVIAPGERVLVPTGLIFDIPTGWSMRLHVRSGTALKQGLTLANSEGVIDADYKLQTFIPIVNLSGIQQTIENLKVIAQGEIVPVKKYAFKQTEERPTETSERVGGFGSTDKAPA